MIQFVPFSLVRGDDSLQRSKRGPVSKRHKGPRFHGAHGADIANDDSIARVLRLPLQKL